MKYIITLLLFTTGYIVKAQTLPVFHKPQPAYILDSVQYKKMPLFDLNVVESITVIKDDKERFPNGAVYLTSKADAAFNFISLEALAKKYIGDTKSYIVMVDDDFIMDMTDYAIDSAFVLKCEIVSTKDFVHMQHMPDMKIVKVTTATDANKAKKRKIMIRG